MESQCIHPICRSRSCRSVRLSTCCRDRRRWSPARAPASDAPSRSRSARRGGRRRQLRFRRGHGRGGRRAKFAHSACAQWRSAPTCRTKARCRHVQAGDRGVRHDRHLGQQRRPAAGCRLRESDAGPVEQGHRRQPHRPIPVRARSGARIQAPRRRAGGVLRSRQDPVHQFGARGDSVGRATSTTRPRRAASC